MLISMMKLLTWNQFFTFNYSKRFKQISSLLANHLTILLNLRTLSYMTENVIVILRRPLFVTSTRVI